jgi:hypothetical protein
MTTQALHPGIGGDSASQAELPPDRALRLARSRIDWRAARRAGHACCCPARPAVVAVMLPSAGRPDPTDLLLCGHHHRSSRQALEAAGALVLDLDGVPVTEGAA